MNSPDEKTSGVNPFSTNIISLLESHDFYYNYSDDISVWDRNSKREDTIFKVLKQLNKDDARSLIETYVPKQFQPEYERVIV